MWLGLQKKGMWAHKIWLHFLTSMIHIFLQGYAMTVQFWTSTKKLITFKWLFKQINFGIAHAWWTCFLQGFAGFFTWKCLAHAYNRHNGYVKQPENTPILYILMSWIAAIIQNSCVITWSVREVSNTLKIDCFLDSSAHALKIWSRKKSAKPCTITFFGLLKVRFVAFPHHAK